MTPSKLGVAHGGAHGRGFGNSSPTGGGFPFRTSRLLLFQVNQEFEGKAVHPLPEPEENYSSYAEPETQIHCETVKAERGGGLLVFGRMGVQMRNHSFTEDNDFGWGEERSTKLGFRLLWRKSGSFVESIMSFYGVLV